jgi:hypothetical protein
VAEWRSRQHLEDHFREHGGELGCRTIEEHDASAQQTLLVGTYFEYEDPRTGLARIGCYDAVSGYFVALTTDDEIVTHYPCPVRHVRRLPYSTYDG